MYVSVLDWKKWNKVFEGDSDRNWSHVMPSCDLESCSRCFTLHDWLDGPHARARTQGGLGPNGDKEDGEKNMWEDGSGWWSAGPHGYRRWSSCVLILQAPFDKTGFRPERVSALTGWAEFYLARLSQMFSQNLEQFTHGSLFCGVWRLHDFSKIHKCYFSR